MEKSELFVDKKNLLMTSLAELMDTQLTIIDSIVQQNPTAAIEYKPDHSPVTELDLLLSIHIESLMEKNFPRATFYSEEKFSDWKFPLLALDPLDGTREYIEGRDEWAISIGIFESEAFQGEGWIYNPKTRECFHGAQPLPFQSKSVYRGEVSRTELKNQLYAHQESGRFLLTPLGSIAYKLGRLAFKKSDFVISLYPKNIWDIAGGTLLCHQAGLKFYSEGKEVTSVEKIYRPPLIWCHEELFLELSKIYL